jgi:hypothetical protein
MNPYYGLNWHRFAIERCWFEDVFFGGSNAVTAYLLQQSAPAATPEGEQLRLLQ